MTISYSGNFVRLLMRWKGSIWRSVWKELLIYLVFYYIIRLYYLFGIDYLDEDEDDRKTMRRRFEAICQMCDNYTKLIPLTFLLGFYVSNVVSRWWRQFECLYWPEDIVSILCSVIPSNEESAQKRRHQIARYVNLASALAWRDISSKIRLRFPTVSSMITAGLITSKEYQMLEEAHDSCDTIRWMTPLHWIQQLLKKEEAVTAAIGNNSSSFQERSPPASLMNNILTELKVFRQSIRRLFCYDWVCVPLVYTQVAALATYAFFFFSLFGRQTLLPNIKSGAQIDLYVPVFSIVQFLFFIGWFKVGQDLMRPFGLDDDDIELNYILDRNISTTFAMVNRLQSQEPPEFEEDVFWMTREGKMDPLPHTKYSIALQEHRPHLHSYVPVDSDDSDKTSQDCFRIKKEKKHLGW